MSTATMTQAHSVRQQIAETLGKIRTFSIEMYQAHGGWFVLDAGQPASVAVARRSNLKLVTSEQSK